MNISSPREAFQYLSPRMAVEVEEFWVLALNSEKRLIAAVCLFRGTVNYCPFHPRDVFRFAYLNNACSLIVAHNHPSGTALPSEQDRRTTRRLLDAAELLEVAVDDHLIVAGETYYSFQEKGELTSGFSPSGRSLD
jgi:DNA repair protein RadC